MSNIAIAPAHRVPGYVSQQQTYQQLVSPFLDLPGLVGLWYGGNYQRSTGDMPNLAPYISGASSQDLSYNGNPNFDYLSNGVGYADLDGTGDYFNVADNTDISITGTETFISNPGITWGGWFWFDNDTTAVDEYTINKFSDYYSRRLSATTKKFFSVIFDTAGANSSIVSANDVEHQQWVYLVSKFVPSTEVSNFVNDSKTTNAASIVANCRNGANALALGAVYNGLGPLDGKFSIGFLCASALNDATIQSPFQQTRSLYGV